MNYELTGKLVDKMDTEQVKESFRKREFVVETNEKSGTMVFTEIIKFQLVQDKCELIDSFNLNDDITVHFNIRGRKWEKNGNVSYFTNLDAWRIEPAKQQATSAGSSPAAPEPPAAPQGNFPPPGENDIPPMTEEDDDLPF
jgi:hypothetical protein